MMYEVLDGTGVSTLRPARNRHMTVTRKSHHDLPGRNERKTVHDLLMEHKKTSRFITEGTAKKQVSIIVLCDGSAPFDEAVLGATPHITMRMEDDLLQKIKSFMKKTQNFGPFL